MKDFIRRLILRLVPPNYIKGLIEQAAHDEIRESAIFEKNVRTSLKTEIFNHYGDRSAIKVGENSVINGELLTFGFGGNIFIGKDCFIGENSRIWSGERVTIGNEVLISHNVNILDTDSHELDHIKRAESYKRMLLEGHPKSKGEVSTTPVNIEDNVWINMNCVILKGVTIGKGSIVGASSVVTKNVPPFTMVAGNPAKVIKKLS
jgi:acetyltransferase-like isoleucine patch superfamily enzyme